MSTSFAKDQPAGFKNYLENIAIIGAGGQSGTYITNALIANGKHKITALTRTNSKYPIPEGVHSIKTIDYSDPSTIVEALKGQDALICTLFVHATDEQEKLSRAAAEAGVKWILPNEFGTASTDEQLARDTYIGVGKAKERKLIQDLGVSSWIGVACSFWYEYSLSAGTWTYGFDIKNRAVILFDDGAKQIDTTTLPQVGRGVANLLSLKVLPDDENDKAPTLSQFRNNFVCMSSFRISQQQMFDSVLRVTGTKREDWNITTESPQARYAMGKAMFEGGDRMGFGLLLYSRVFFPDAAGQHPRNDNAALGLAEENLDECTAVAVKMAEEDYFLKHVVPRTVGSNN